MHVSVTTEDPFMNCTLTTVAQTMEQGPYLVEEGTEMSAEVSNCCIW